MIDSIAPGPTARPSSVDPNIVLTRRVTEKLFDVSAHNSVASSSDQCVLGKRTSGVGRSLAIYPRHRCYRSNPPYVRDRSLRELKEFGEDREDGGKHRRGQDAESLTEAIPIQRADLVERHTALFAAEATGRPKRIGMSGGRHGRNERRPQVMIELVGRNDEAGPRFADLAAARWIKFDEIDLAAIRNAGGPTYRQSHSS
jgi:hypothetical protein